MAKKATKKAAKKTVKKKTVVRKPKPTISSELGQPEPELDQ